MCHHFTKKKLSSFKECVIIQNNVLIFCFYWSSFLYLTYAIFFNVLFGKICTVFMCVVYSNLSLIFSFKIHLSFIKDIFFYTYHLFLAFHGMNQIENRSIYFNQSVLKYHLFEHLIIFICIMWYRKRLWSIVKIENGIIFSFASIRDFSVDSQSDIPSTLELIFNIILIKYSILLTFVIWSQSIVICRDHFYGLVNCLKLYTLNQPFKTY